MGSSRWRKCDGTEGLGCAVNQRGRKAMNKPAEGGERGDEETKIGSAWCLPSPPRIVSLCVSLGFHLV